jgi:hypothetical protein
MDKKAFQILLAEDHVADTAKIREALKHRHVHGDDILNRLRATRQGRRIPVVAISGRFGPHFVAQEGFVCFSKPSAVDEFLRLGATVSGLLPQGRRAEASGPETGS